MKATIRYVINPPLEASKSLKERILNSISPSITSGNDDDSNYDPLSSSFRHSVGSTTSISGSSTQYANSKNTGLLESEITMLEMHPCKPLVCYVDINAGNNNYYNVNNAINDKPSISSKQNLNNSSNTKSEIISKQRIILQNHLSNHTIAIIPFLDIVKRFDVNQKIKHSDSATSGEGDFDQIKNDEQINQLCQSFGLITSIQFMDLHVLQHESGIVQPMTATTKSNNNKSTTSTPHSYLILNFHNRILLYPIDNHHQSIIEITNNTLNKANITSKRIIPVTSTNLLAIGCSDGAIRFYSLCDKKIVKSVRGPNGKNDPVVGILCINSWDWSSSIMAHNYNDEYDLDNNDFGNNNGRVKNEGHDGSILGGTDGGGVSGEKCYTKSTITKIMTFCASGTAYLWELQVAFSESTGCVKKFHIRPPLLKMDCSSFLSNAISSMSNSPFISNQVGSIVQRNCENLKYDSIRNLLFWTVQPTHNSSLSKAYVLVWNMSPERIALTQQQSQTKSDISNAILLTPVHHPQSIIQIPSGDFILSDATMISGLVHSSFPIDAYTCLAVSRDGNISLIASSCEQPVTSTAKKKVNDDANVYYYFNFLSMKRAADEKVLGKLPLVKDGKLRITKVASSFSRPDVIVMATNIGLIVVTLNDEDQLVSGSIHSCFTSANANSNGFIGTGNKILLVKDSSVYRAKLDFNPTTAMPNPVGQLNYQDMVLFYRSPPATHKSIEFQARPIRMPPRLLPSPSGNFLCLFWHTENRYEIIHNSSITNAARKSTRDQGPEYSPAVDVGNNVLSFAWVGDEDIFALLFPPELNKNDAVTLASKKKNRNMSSITQIGDIDENDEDDAPIDPAKFKPRVELKILVGVNKDAVEFSVSVAAATATFLGTLSLRGRHPPTTLFGGPVLCVGCLSQDKDSSHMDGMAYFYSRRLNSEENDNRAVSFTSVGPALPYPDLVVWDDDGKICAIIVGRRIALYIAEPPNFKLLSTAYLGTADESDAKIQSAKFVHGVLYCSTQSSIQCIFFGDVENEDVVCEVDSFVLSSSNASFETIKSSIRPNPQPLPLIRPSILGYLHGSLLVSTVYGLHTVSLAHPIIRIGALLASGHISRAIHWLDAFDTSHHEVLANFLDRRGYPDLSIQLSGLSLETIVDFSLRYGYTDYLMRNVELYGIKNVHMLDMGRGVSGDNSSYSMIVCIGMYLVSQGKENFVLHMANVCLTLGESGRKEAFTLGTLLVSAYPEEARDLIERAVTETSPNSKPLVDTWPLAMYIKTHML